MRSPAVVAWSAMVMALAGCAVGPDYQAPALEDDSGWVAEQNAATGPRAARPGWWQSLDDPLLDELVAAALAENLDLAAAAARVRESEALVRVAGAALYPQVDVGASGTRFRLSESSPRAGSSLVNAGLTPSPDSVYDVGASFAWELDLFGGIRRRRESALAGYDGALAESQAVKLAIAAAVVSTYGQLRGRQRELAVTRRNAELQRQFADLVARKVKTGIARKLEQRRAEAEAEATAARLPALEGLVRDSIYTLSVLTGQPPEAWLPRLADVQPPPAPPERLNLGTRLAVLQGRPDVLIAERRLASATADVGVAVADLYPKIGLVGDGGWEAGSTGDLFSSAARSWTLTPAVTWSVFRGGELRGREAAARARMEAAEIAYRQTVLTALQEAESAAYGYGRLLETRDHLRESAAAIGETASIARGLYERGLADFLTVIQAEQRQREVEAELARAETLTLVGFATLQRALGGCRC